MSKTALEMLSSTTRDFACKNYGHFIANEWWQAKAQFDLEDPASGKVFTQIGQANQQEVNAAVDAARISFDSGVWREKSPTSKAQIMWRIAELIQKHQDTLAELESLDNGKPVQIARLGDVALTADHFRYYAGWCGKYEGGQINLSSSSYENLNFHAYTQKEPVGVVAQIIPWNFPLLMAAWKLAPALASGCSVVLKPAEQTPLSAIYLMNLLQEAGLPAGVVNLVNGHGTTGALLSGHNQVDKVAFTGSNEVGKLIIQAAKDNIKKVSLELGGKSPNIIFPDANIKSSIKGAANAIFFNHGQCCCAGSRLFIHEKVYDQVLSGVTEYAANIKLGIGMDPNTHMGPLVSKEQQEKVLAYISQAQKDGAKITTGGKSDKSSGYFVQPTVITNTQESMNIVKEEIFGPVLVVDKFSDTEEAVKKANNSIFGLAAGVWTQDINTAHKVSSKLKAGTVWVNCYNIFDAALPFGGYKQSGWGREMGSEGLDLYYQTKTTCMGLGKK